MPEDMPRPETEAKESNETKFLPGQMFHSGRVFLRAVRMWFKDLINLEEGLDREGTIVSIKSSKIMRGANAWLLVCSIMVASLGLDLNSAAVIIGAMLISPLMAPILGIGLAVGINDRDALYLAIRQFSIAILIALVTSILYFLITPLGALTEEIDKRTAPTLLDGLVAVFGGLAGIISTSRKEKGSAIPGVAIATALMPPLCVTGFGIATGNWKVALNSFYLFFLNSFFIALTTFLIIRLLHFPLKEKLEEQEGRRTRLIVTVFSLLISIPSIYILYDIWHKRQEMVKIEQFVQSHFGKGAATSCIGYSLLREDTSKQLVLQLLGKFIPADSVITYKTDLGKMGFKNIDLSLIQGAAMNLEQISRMQAQLSGMDQLVNRLQESEAAKIEQEQIVREMDLQKSNARQDSTLFVDMSQELKVLFPNVQEMRYAQMRTTNFKDSIIQMPTYLIHWSSSRARKADEPKLYNFVKVRSKLDTLELINY